MADTAELVIAPPAPAALPSTVPPTLQALLRAADSGADIDRLEKLMELHERFEHNEARKAFERAMSDFRSEQMVILKSKFVDIAGGAKFHHAQLADVCEAVIGNMSKYGLRHKWKTEQPDKMVRVTCVISHALGYSDPEPPSLTTPPDTAGNKSPIHAIASAVALLERYTLLAAVGLAAKYMDSNPRGTGTTDPAGTQEKAPSDYENWKADARAIADEGVERLKTLWDKTPQNIRLWVVRFDLPYWEDLKARAKKVTTKGNAQ